MAESGEIEDAPVAQVEAGEVAAQAADEIVALYCSYKQADQTGDDFVEIVKGDQPFFKLRAKQWKNMTRAIAQWHLGKSRRWDVSNPLQLSIKTLEEIATMKAALQAAKHAKADQEAQAAKAAKAEQDRLEAEAAAATKLRRDLLDKALGAGVIKTSAEADGMTNQDLAELVAAAN